MRLWHYDLLAFLPRSQLLAQWRELNSIYAKQDQHLCSLIMSTRMTNPICMCTANRDGRDASAGLYHTQF